ncbi:MAG: hypothetical protein AAF599_04890, partial [Bacteroidota bacterium]
RFPISFNVKVIVDEPTLEYRFFLWDKDDFSDDDFIGGFFFTPYTRGQDFPKQIEYRTSSYHIIFDVQYGF